MPKKLSNWLNETITGPIALICLVFFLLFTGLVLPQQSSRAEEQTGASGSPDTSFIYTPTDLYRFADAYGEAGRRAYIRARFTFDLAWPLVYTLFLCTSLSWLFTQFTAPGSIWRRANLLPVAGMLLDYLENLSTSLVMVRYPQPTPLVDWLAPVFSLLKWGFIGSSFALLLIGVLIWLIGPVKKRFSGPKD